MRVLKMIAVAGVLSAVVGTAQAADGMERIQNFHAQFQAEQQRLWGDRGEERKEQQVVEKDKAEKKADS